MDDGRLLGSRPNSGVQVLPPNYEKSSRAERVVIAVPYYKESAYWTFLRERRGKPYDKLAIAAFAFNRDWRSPDASRIMDRLNAIAKRQAPDNEGASGRGRQPKDARA
jgi:hypothetical protein